MRNLIKKEAQGKNLTTEEICEILNSSGRKKVKIASCSRYTTVVSFQFVEQFIRELYEMGLNKFPISSQAMKSSGWHIDKSVSHTCRCQLDVFTRR